MIGNPKHIYMVAQPSVTERVLEVACDYFCVCEKGEIENYRYTYFLVGTLFGILCTVIVIAGIDYSRNSVARAFQIVADTPVDRRRGINHGRGSR